MDRNPSYFSNVLSTDYILKQRIFSSRLRPFPDLEEDVYFDSEEHTSTLAFQNKLFIGTRSGLFSVLDTTQKTYQIINRKLLNPQEKIRDIVAHDSSAVICQDSGIHLFDLNRFTSEGVHIDTQTRFKSVDALGSLIIASEKGNKVRIFTKNSFPKCRYTVETEHELTCVKFLDSKSIVASDMEGFVSFYDIRNLQRPVKKELFTTGEYDITSTGLTKRFVCTWLTLSHDRSKIAAISHGDFVSVIESSQLENMRTSVNFTPKIVQNEASNMYACHTSSYDIRSQFSYCGEWLAVGSPCSQFSLVHLSSETVLNVNTKIGRAMFPNFVDPINIAVSCTTDTGSFIRRRGLKLQDIDGVSFYPSNDVLYTSFYH